MIHLQIAYVTGFNHEGLHLKISLRNIDKSLVLSFWVCVKENSSSAERGAVDFILGFPRGKLHDLEQGINEEPFRGAGQLQLPLMALELCALPLLGRLTLTLGQAVTTLTFWWLCSCFFCPILWWLAPNVQEPSSVPVKGLKSVPGPFLCQICSSDLAVCFLQHE